VSSLCGAVELELGKAFGAEALQNWVIEHDGADSCRVRTPKFLITFNMDQRDGLIMSSILFLEAEEPDREQLYTHVICRLFSDKPSNISPASRSMLENIETEVSNICIILRAIEEERLTPRDLRYFYLGYNNAYSDYS